MIFDGRNLSAPARMRKIGIEYGIGRGASVAAC
jgi:hypothetical protein